MENCTYDHNSGPCLQAYPDGCYWFESNGLTNWTITASRFLGCNAGAAQGIADLFVAACAPTWHDGLPDAAGNPITVGQPFADVHVTHSTFLQDRPHQAIGIWGSDGIEISGNTIGCTNISSAIVVQPGWGSDSADTAMDVRGGLMSSLDGFAVSSSAAVVRGWVVDPSLAPSQPSTVVIRIDNKTVATVVANTSRPDLVPVVTSNPNHGFDTTLPSAAVALLQQGNHTLAAFAVVNGIEIQLTSSPQCVNRYRMQCFFPQPCYCGAPLPALITISNSLQCVARGNICNGGACHLELDGNTMCSTQETTTRQG